MGARAREAPCIQQRKHCLYVASLRVGTCLALGGSRPAPARQPSISRVNEPEYALRSARSSRDIAGPFEFDLPALGLPLQHLRVARDGPVVLHVAERGREPACGEKGEDHDAVMAGIYEAEHYPRVDEYIHRVIGESVYDATFRRLAPSQARKLAIGAIKAIGDLEEKAAKKECRGRATLGAYASRQSEDRAERR